MRIRTSENIHQFQTQLFQRLDAYSLQGLLMNDKHEFTAAVEAVEYEAGDEKGKLPFREPEIYARYILAREAGIPLFILCYMDSVYKILSVREENGRVKLRMAHQFSEKEFIQWWGELKQTVQTKQLNNGGEPRIGETIIDSVLRKYGYEWGGNIDGFVLTEDRNHIEYVIDNISVSQPNLADEPSHYFHSPNPKHGPRYEGWYAAVKLAAQLQVPHLLFTIDKKEQMLEHIGLTVIERLTPDGIFFAGGVTPDHNILCGLENIVQNVQQKAQFAVPPVLQEKDA